MSLSCYIVDDELYAARIIEQFILETEGVHVVGIKTSPLDALAELQAEPLPDIVFLDVDMPKINGLKLASGLRGRTQLIFTTSFRDFAPEAFEMEALDYLLKPISQQRFAESINRVKTRLGASQTTPPSHLFLRTGLRSDLARIPFEEITYISGLESYCEIHLGHKKLIVYQTLKELTGQLPPAQFSRVHKSYIVNHRFIKLVKGQLIVLGDELIPIGRAYRKDFISKLSLRNANGPGDPAS